MQKVKVSLAQAVEFAQSGFEIECYVLPKEKPLKKERARRVYVPLDAMIGLSVEGRDPTKGELSRAWPKAKAELWGKDITLVYSRGNIEKMLHVNGSSDNTAFNYLLKKAKVLRRAHE